MSFSSMQKSLTRGMRWVATLLVVAIVGCSSVQSRNQTDARPSGPDYSQHDPVNKLPFLTASQAARTPVIQTRSEKKSDVILTAATVLALSEQDDRREPSQPVEQVDTGADESNGKASEPLGQDEKRPPVAVDALVQQAFAVHPKLRAARSRVAAAQFRIPQQRALPDPMAETMFWPITENAQQLATGRMTNQISLSQTVPWPEKLRAQAAVAVREVGIAQAELRQIEREIAESVRLAYYEVWFSTQATRIVSENRQLTEQLVSIAQNRFRSGGSQQDVIRAELEVEKRDQQLLEINQQLEIAQAELATLVQQPLGLSVVTIQALPVSDVSTQLDTLLVAAQQHNPTLQGLAWQIQRDLQKQRLATLQKYPDLTYGVQYGMMTTSQSISPVADGIDNLSFSVGTTLPIWKTKIRAGTCQVAAEKDSSAQLHQSEWNSIAGRLRRLVQQAHSLDQQRTLYVEKIIPRAEQAFEISQSEYTVGKSSFFQLIDNFSEVLTFRVEVARIEASLAGVLAQIERTVGCEDRSGS